MVCWKIPSFYTSTKFSQRTQAPLFADFRTPARFDGGYVRTSSASRWLKYIKIPAKACRSQATGSQTPADLPEVWPQKMANCQWNISHGLSQPHSQGFPDAQWTSPLGWSKQWGDYDPWISTDAEVAICRLQPLQHGQSLAMLIVNACFLFFCGLVCDLPAGCRSVPTWTMTLDLF